MIWLKRRVLSMDASALANAEFWLFWISKGKLIAAFLVAIGVAMEFGSDWLAAPFEATVKAAREKELAELHLETEKLAADGEIARKETAEAKLRLEQLRKQMGPRSISPTRDD